MLVGTCAFALVEHLHVHGVVVVLELVVDVVRRRRAHVAWRCLALHDDVDQECDGGHHGDVDVDELRLHRVGAPKMIDLLAAALRMMKGKKTCSQPPCLVVDPLARPTWCRCSPFSLLRSGVCRWQGCRGTLAR